MVVAAAAEPGMYLLLYSRLCLFAPLCIAMYKDLAGARVLCTSVFRCVASVEFRSVCAALFLLSLRH